MAIIYFYNPLSNVELSLWDRTICGAILAGISVDKRITNFYILVLVLFPLLFIVFNIINNLYLRNNTIIKNAFKFSIPLFSFTLLMYLLKFNGAIDENFKFIFMLCIVLIHALLIILGRKKLFIFNDRKPKEINIKNKKINYKNLFINFYFVLILIYFICPLSLPNAQNYSGIREFVSMCIINNDTFIIETVIYILLSIFLVLILYLIDNNFFNDNRELKDFLFDFGLVTIFSIISAFIYHFAAKPLSELGKTIIVTSYNSIIDDVSTYMILVAGIIIYAIISYYINKKNSSVIKDPFGSIFVYSFGTILLNIFIKNFLVSNVIILALIISKEFFLKKNISNGSSLYSYLTVGIFWLPTVYAIVVSILFILNEKGIFVKNYLIVVLLTMIFFELIFCLILKRANNIKMEKKLIFLGGIISITCIAFFQTDYQITFNYHNYANVYELGNNSVAADTLIFGKLPIIEYFSAHALSDVLDEIIYSIFHADLMGIFISSNLITNIVGVLALFYILAQVIPLNFAAFSLLMIPLNVSGLKSYSASLVVVAALCYMWKNKSLKSFILFWFCALFSAFYMYDEGIYLGIACIVTYIVLMQINKDKETIQSFIICGILVGTITLIFLGLYCLTMDIDFISRVKEWISLGMGSNSTWATDKFADYSSISFLFAYFVVPCSAVCILIVELSKVTSKSRIEIIDFLIIIFAIVQLLFIPRTIIFHNLFICRGKTGVLLNYWPWTISFFVLSLVKEKDLRDGKKFISWAVSLIMCIATESMLVTFLFPSNSSSIISVAANNSNEFKISSDMSDIWGLNRVVVTNETSEFYVNFEELFDLLLDDEETFLDFANITSLYAYTKRVRPFYVAQSPSLLTNLYSQECYLEEIEKYKVPLAITGNTGEDFIRQMMYIPHNVRYYKIAEYIYSIYKPIARIGDFTVWGDKNNYSKYITALKSHQSSLKYEIVDYGYDSNTDSHFYYIDNIPYLWANADQYNAIDNTEICSLNKNEKGEYIFKGSQSIESITGSNYLMFCCTSAQDNDIVLDVTLQDESNSSISYTYSMFVKHGKHNYLLRVSQDYFWKAYNINSVKFSSTDNKDINIHSVKILEGD